jgi:hypothetical protein
MPASQHLLGYVLNALFVLCFGAVGSLRVDVLQIRLKELDVPSISQANVLILADVFPLPVRITKVIQKRATKVGCVGNICHFIEVIWKRQGDEVAQSGELNVLEILGSGEVPERLAIGPDIAIRHTEQI